MPNIKIQCLFVILHALPTGPTLELKQNVCCVHIACQDWLPFRQSNLCDTSRNDIPDVRLQLRGGHVTLYVSMYNMEGNGCTRNVTLHLKSVEPEEFR